MFALLAAQIPGLLLKYVLPFVISWLRKEGFFNAAEAIAAKGAIAVVKEVKSLKIDPTYPSQDSRGQSL